jgi:hypothetical protein
MTKANLNPTIDDYRGSIGKLVFKKYRGRTIVAKKPVITAEHNQAQVAQRIRFNEAAAFGRFAQNDPEPRAIYGPIARARGDGLHDVRAGLPEENANPASRPVAI